MAKYIVDIDALIKCCDFLSEGKLNGNDYTYVQNVKCLIERFPKDKVRETITIEIKNNVEITDKEYGKISCISDCISEPSEEEMERIKELDSLVLEKCREYLGEE